MRWNCVSCVNGCSVVEIERTSTWAEDLKLNRVFLCVSTFFLGGASQIDPQMSVLDPLGRML